MCQAWTEAINSHDKKGTTTMMSTTTIYQFDIEVTASGTGLDVHAVLNGNRTAIAFGQRVKGVKGYTFIAFSLTQFPAALSEQARMLEWYGSDAVASSGLTRKEFEKRAHTLGGLWLAGETTRVASV